MARLFGQPIFHLDLAAGVSSYEFPGAISCGVSLPAQS